MQKIYLILFALCLTTSFAVQAQTTITVTDDDLTTGTYNWTSDNVYILDGLVFLESGGTLNIEAGTVIKAMPNMPDGDASALIITRGAQIFAEGTADAPIIFTAFDDDTDDPGDFSKIDRGEWGGVIVLGRATIARPGGEDGIDGINANEARAKFGGAGSPDDSDNSGVLRYISIRHGGAALAPGDEINGLTLGGVGSETTIEYVDVFANFDDGIEIFGGTVNVKYASVAFCGDDSFDYDYGWRGMGQFWFSLHDVGPGSAGRGGEHDGANPDGQEPFSQPLIYNATYIGSGPNPANVPDGEGNDLALLFRDNAGGYYFNSIFTEYQAGVAIEDREGTEVDALGRLQNGDLGLFNNIFHNFGNGDLPTDLFLAWNDSEQPLPSSTTVQGVLLNTGNEIIDPLLAGISRNDDGGLDPRPEFGPATSGAISGTDPFYSPAAFYGAFSPTADNWLDGWSALSEYGHLGDIASDVNDPARQAGFELLAPTPTPTPTSEVATVAIVLPRAATIDLAIYDLWGRRVATVAAGTHLPQGENYQTIDVSQLANGTYTLMLQSAGVQLAQKLLVVR